MSRSKETKAPLETTSEDWALLPWRKLERHVYRLQKRIFRAAERGNDESSPPITAVTDAFPIDTAVGSATGYAGQPG